MKGYNSYKDSGVEWIGVIPENWDNVRLKLISSITKGRKPNKDYEDNLDGFLPYLSMEYLRDKTDEPVYADANEKNIVLVDEGDILILWDGSKAGEIVRAKKGILSSTMAKIEIYDNRFESNFLNYLLQLGEKHIQANTIGMGIPHVNGNILKDLMMLLPTVAEQTAIASFLDYKTNLIDATIEKKKRLIALLKEKRQAVINEAVTKGLNPNATMKDSGVEWLGEIPEHWSIVKLKHIADMRSGNFISAEIIEQEDDYPVYGGNGLRGFTSAYTHEGFFPLIGRQGALCGNINYASGKFWATEHAVVVSSVKEINLYWLGELLRLMNLNQYSQASAQPGLSVEKILNLRIPFPTIKEQNLIAQKIEDLNSKIELSELNLKTSIEKLQTYRQSLISEAVTGKIDVRDWDKAKN